MVSNESSSELEEIEEYEEKPFCQPITDAYFAIPIFIISFIGMIVHSWNLYRLYYLSSSRGSFRQLWMSRSIANMCIFLVFLIYQVPTIVCNNQIPTQTIGYFIANWSGTPYLTIMFVQILLSIHRFAASYSIKWNDRIGSYRSTMIQLLIAWIIGILSTVQWLVEDCYFYFDEEWFSWEEECAEWIVDISTGIPVKASIVIVAIFNGMTLYQLVNVMKYKRSTSSTTWNPRLKRNARILLQGFLQDCFFIMDIIVQYYIAPLYDTKYWYYLCYSISWSLSHLFDGCVMTIFNEELRRPIAEFLGMERKTVVQMPIRSVMTPKIISTSIN